MKIVQSEDLHMHSTSISIRNCNLIPIIVDSYGMDKAVDRLDAIKVAAGLSHKNGYLLVSQERRTVSYTLRVQHHLNDLAVCTSHHQSVLINGVELKSSNGCWCFQFSDSSPILRLSKLEHVNYSPSTKYSATYNQVATIVGDAHKSPTRGEPNYCDTFLMAGWSRLDLKLVRSFECVLHRGRYCREKLAPPKTDQNPTSRQTPIPPPPIFPPLQHHHPRSWKVEISSPESRTPRGQHVQAPISLKR